MVLCYACVMNEWPVMLGVQVTCLVLCKTLSLKYIYSNAHAQPNIKKTLNLNISLCGSDNDVKCYTFEMYCILLIS